MAEASTAPKKIDTSGSSVTWTEDGRMQLRLDERITPRAFQHVVEYLYTDHISFDRDTDKDLIREVQQAAQVLGLDRLEIMCETYLDRTKNIAVPDSKWWQNMKWAFENLREGDNSLADLAIITRGDAHDVRIPVHAVILTSGCKYFYGMLLGEVDTEEKKKMEIVIEDATEKQMLSILKFIYTREFDVDVADVVGVWVLSNKFLLEDLQIECETLVMKNINKDNVADIKEIAKMVDSKRILEICNEFENREKK